MIGEAVVSGEWPGCHHHIPWLEDDVTFITVNYSMDREDDKEDREDLAATPRRSKRRMARRQPETEGERGVREGMGLGGRKKRSSGGLRGEVGESLGRGGESMGVVRGTSGSYVTSVRTSADFSKNSSEADLLRIGQFDTSVFDKPSKDSRAMDTSETVWVTLEDVASQSKEDSRSRRSSDGSNDSSTVMVPTGIYY